MDDQGGEEFRGEFVGGISILRGDNKVTGRDDLQKLAQGEATMSYISVYVWLDALLPMG
jgi:hypothetical protein